MAETRFYDEELKAAFPLIVQDEAAKGEFSHFLVPKDLLAGDHPLPPYPTELAWQVDTLMGCQQSPHSRTYGLHYLFTLGSSQHWVLLSTELAGGDRLFPSITPHIHAAKWYEREIRDMFGLIPQGHPDLRRLIRHEHWPKGTHPLKKDFPWDRVLGRQQGEHHFRRIEGEGVFEVPVGPIHAGIIEPGHFRFSVAGEPIMQLELHHFWTHRGVEKAVRATNTDRSSSISRTSIRRYDDRP